MSTCAWTKLNLKGRDKVAYLPAIASHVFLDHNCCVAWIQHLSNERKKNEYMKAMKKATGGQEIRPAPTRSRGESCSQFLKRYDSATVPELMKPPQKRLRPWKEIEKAVDIDVAVTTSRRGNNAVIDDLPAKRARVTKKKKPPPAKRPRGELLEMRSQLRRPVVPRQSSPRRHADLPPAPTTEAEKTTTVIMKTVQGRPERIPFDLAAGIGFIELLMQRGFPVDQPMACELNSNSITLHPYCVIDPAVTQQQNYRVAYMQILHHTSTHCDPVRGAARQRSGAAGRAPSDS